MFNFFLKPFFNVRGDAKLKLLIAVVVIAIIVYIVMNVAPLWIEQRRLRNDVGDIVRFSTCRQQDLDKKAIFDRVKKIPNVSVKEDQVTFKCESGRKKANVSYRQLLELPGFRRSYSFEVNVDIPTF
jgi:Tfp pilus assembly protein FimT